MAIEVDGPLTVSDIAGRAGLTIPGAQKALWKLYKSGFVSRVGGGRKHQYEISRSDRLMQVAIELFQAEKDRYEQLLAKIKKEITNLAPHPHAAWIQAFPNDTGVPLELGVLHETLHLTNFIRQLRTQLDQVEKVFDITIEVCGYTKADISDLRFESFTPLYGVMPSSGSNSRKIMKCRLTHTEKDRQLKELSRKLAGAIEKDASLLKRTIEHVDRLLKNDQGTATRDIMEWRDILKMYSIQRLSQFLTSSSDRANRLRQSNPFFAILTSEEQSRLVNALEDKSDA
jgi:DNA-binding MarR family transcriptional regulator